MKKSLIREIPGGKVSLENEMFPKWLKEQKKIYAVEHNGYFIDIGVPEDYFRFCREHQKNEKWRKER